MKLAKLSLAAIVVAGLATSSFAADTLADAFKNGKVSGQLKAYYFDENHDVATKDANIFGTSVKLGYVTDSLKGFKAGFEFIGVSTPDMSENAGYASTGKVFQADMDGSGAVLSEAYLAYTMGKTTAKAGRMHISTPLIKNSGSRLNTDSFEGYVLTNTDLPATTLVAGYVTKHAARTDNKGSIGEFIKFNPDNAYTLLAVNKSLPGTTLTAQYLDVVDSYSDIYAEVAYDGKASNFKYGLAAQYLDTSYDATTSKDSNAYGLKASLGMGAFNAYVAYSKIDDDNAVKNGLGHGAHFIFTSAYLKAGSYEKGTEAYAVDASYNFKDLGVTVGARYSETDATDVGGEEWAYTSFRADYAVAGIKGLTLGFAIEDLNRKDTANKDMVDMRFMADYKF